MNLVVTLDLNSVFNDSHERFLIHLKCCGVYYDEFYFLCPVILFYFEGVDPTPFHPPTGYRDEGRGE